MFEKYTDLAMEVRELHGEESGIDVEERMCGGIKITTATVNEGIGEKLSGKRAGEYITLDVGKVWQYEKAKFNEIASVLADEIKKILPEGEREALIVGLGNEAITPDSVGPRVVKKLIVTRHIKGIDPLLYDNAGFGNVSAIAPGVLGQTGIESAEIIKSVCESINPKCVIAIDSLASRRLSRLATTVQLSNGGISPGSGVSNKRVELSEKTLGVPVISLGVPTVVDAATLAYDLLEEHTGSDDEEFAEIIEKVLAGNGKNMFITLKDNDVIAAETAKLISTAINLALHDIGIEEMNEFIG